MSIVLRYADIVEPRPVDATAMAIAQDASVFSPTPSGAFDHGTTSVSTAIPAPIVLGLTTASSSAALIIATTQLEDRVNVLDKLINRLVYVAEANGLTS